MTGVPDNELMCDFADRQSDAAFAQIVPQHINLVHSIALRFTGNAEDARDASAGLRKASICAFFSIDRAEYAAVEAIGLI